MAKEGFDTEKSGESSSLDRLERQVERGSLFTHTALSDNADRINEAEFMVYGLVDLLIEKGALESDEVFRAAARVQEEMEAKGETIGPGVALRVDEAEEKDDFVPVNCAERIHICKAVCCKLQFALSAEEVESGDAKWDLGRPYFARKESTGYCTHNDPEKKSCQIYDDRPTVCRRYSCAKDGRIWKNFEEMELNEEWINENLAESRPLLARAMMFKQEEHKEASVDPSSDPDGELDGEPEE